MAPVYRFSWNDDLGAARRLRRYLDIVTIKPEASNRTPSERIVKKVNWGGLKLERGVTI